MKKRNLNLCHTREGSFQKHMWVWLPFIRPVTLKKGNEIDCTCFTGYPTVLTRKRHLFWEGNHLVLLRALSPEHHGDHSWEKIGTCFSNGKYTNRYGGREEIWVEGSYLF